MGSKSKGLRNTMSQNRPQRSGIGKYLAILTTAAGVAYGAFEFSRSVEHTDANRPVPVSSTYSHVPSTDVVANGSSSDMISGIKLSPTEPFEFIYRLDQVRSGKISIQEYVNHLYKLPEIKAAKKAHLLREIVYNPTDKKLREMLSNFKLKLRDENGQEKNFADFELDVYKNNERDLYANTIPFTALTTGIPIGRYIVIQPSILGHNVESDNDVRSMMTHELRHIIDDVYGITLGDMRVSFGSRYGLDTLSGVDQLDIATDILELRANYLELQNMFSMPLFGRTDVISTSYRINPVVNYYKNWKALRKRIKGSSTIEEELIKRQLEKCSGIVPFENGNRVTLRFNINGREGDLVFIKR
ncbi:MAG: hypothetical protein HY831_02110 [Candidatus Aenigmarchaeota archaeon]|nr:hypothetical protein [Candidatus Aenigmarchaeota archaeon]